jgi:hypothetical protein
MAAQEARGQGLKGSQAAGQPGGVSRVRSLAAPDERTSPHVKVPTKHLRARSALGLCARNCVVLRTGEDA